MGSTEGYGESTLFTYLIARPFSALAIGLGVIALFGWITDLSLLTSFGKEWIPMAPSTALLFILFGSAVYVAAQSPRSPGSYWLGVTIGSVGSLVALLLFCLSYRNIRIDAEHLGFNVFGNLDGAPLGHMSPATALGFLFSGLGLVATLQSSPRRTGLATAGFWLAGLVTFAAVVFLLAYLFGHPLLYGGNFIPPALTTCIAFVALGMALLALSWQRAWTSDRQIDAEALLTIRPYALIFALLCIGLIKIGAIYHEQNVMHHRTEIEQALSAIADLKVNMLANWRQERLADATLLYNNAVFADLVKTALENPRNASARDRLDTWLQKIRQANDYEEIHFIDAQGVARFSVPGHPPYAKEIQSARQAMLSNGIRLGDLHRDQPGDTPHLSLLVPIIDQAADGHSLGVLMLEIDPDRNLYLLLHRGLAFDSSAETLLVRREGNMITYLNESKSRDKAPLSLSYPLTNTEMVGVKAALGETGIVAGADYRGEPVIAALRAVPGMPWFLIVSVSESEFLASLRDSLWQTSLLVASVLLAAGAGLGFVWWHQLLRHYAQRTRDSEALASYAKRYHTVAQTAPDAIVTADDRGEIVSWNRAAESMFGYRQSEAVGQSLTLLMPERYHEEHDETMKRTQPGTVNRTAGNSVRQIIGLRRDGGEFPVDISLAEWFNGNKRYFTAIMRDMTERETARQELQRQKDLYDMLSQINQSIVRITTQEELFPLACQIAVEHGHFLFAWIGMIEAGSPGLRPVARYGEDKGYTDQLHRTREEAALVKRGLTGQTLLSGMHVVSNDFLDDPAMEPWCESAWHSGVRSMAKFPIRQGGEVIGAFSLYAREKNFFTETLVQTLDEIVVDISFALDNFVRESKRQEAEAALHNSEERYRQLFNANPQPMWVIDSDTLEFLAVNEAAVAHYGWTKEEFLSMTIEDIRPPEEIPFLREHFVANGDKNSRQVNNVKHCKKDGTLISVDISSNAIKFGELNARIVTAIDVTERRKAEKELRIAAKAFDAQEGIVVTDAGGLVLQINQAFRGITGYSSEDMIGRDMTGFTSDRHDKTLGIKVRKALREQDAWQGEAWCRRKNDEDFPAWFTVSAVRDENAKLTNCVITLIDVSPRKEAEKEIQYLAFYDSLTQLPNRRLLQDRLRQSMAASARSGRRGGLLFIDLDNFKTLNDSLGHNIGDQLLQQAAKRLVDCVREGDTVSRFGGDEFVVILNDLSSTLEEAATQAETVGRKVLAILSQPYVLARYERHITASIGICLFRGHEDSIDELLKRTDMAMYQAKTAGRHALCFFDPEMQAAAKARAALETDLHLAVKLNQLLLFYQPQVAGNGLGVTGAEVLLRWQHPRRGLVTPAEFIPLAEDTGLILPLGHWVLETACKQLNAWTSRPDMAHLTLAVNISARQLHNPDFVDQVLSVIDQTGADPRKLKLELTESMLLQDVEDCIIKMAAIKERGVSFALDDFGKGYSSLIYLKQLPLDRLKIDRSFVKDILTDANDAAIARTIVALAKSMGIGVIAEGVETEEQRDFLARLDCHNFQGYLYGRPMPLEKFEEWCKSNR